MLESSGSIGKSKRHDTPFKRSVASVEGGFPFIALLDPDKVVSVPYVKWQNTTWSWSGEPELTEGT